MSLGQHALYIATTPGAVARIAALDAAERPEFERPEAASKREVLDALEQSLADAIGLVRTILLNQWYHHRGEMQVYLRLLDMPVPSVYGPTADENPFAAPAPLSPVS